MEFGDRTGSRYAVIVCPRCRQHAQITELGKKTLRCQHCGALLQARKLRVLGSFEELPEAVDFRTRLQAEISGKGTETFSLNTFQKETGRSGSEDKPIQKTPELSVSEVSSGSVSAGKNHKSIMTEILEASGGKMKIEEFREKALEKGIVEEKFETTLKKLMETGEIYSPEPGIVKLI
jgi:DNA replicative helicase MCM subunit Mcm2 (Cdc46/Mcm family)